MHTVPKAVLIHHQHQNYLQILLYHSPEPTENAWVLNQDQRQSTRMEELVYN